MMTRPRFSLAERLLRWTALPAALLVGRPASAQTTPPTNGDGTVVLSPFEVRTDQDRGFAAASALAGGRLATDLKDTPVAYSVINREMIDALGLVDLTQAADWTTNSFRFPDGAGGGDTFNITTPVAVRGILGNNPLRQRNFFPYYSESDSYNIERYDFGRGPNQVLFGNGTVGGMQVTMTKRPRFDHPFLTLETSYGSWKNARVVLDANRPIGDKVALRTAFVWGDRNGWRLGEMERRKAAFASLAVRPFKQTELRVEAEVGRIERRIPDAKLNDRFGGWDGAYNAGLLSTLPSNNGALGIDRRGGNYFIYNPNSGPQAIMGLQNWAITRGSGDTTTTPAGKYLQVGQVSWNQSNATILNAIDVVPERFDRALKSSKLFIPGREFTTAPDAPLLTSHFNDVQATLNRQFGANFFVEIAGDVNKVDNNINRFESDSITTYIDINPTLPGGAANPNYLRPYGDGRFWTVDRPTEVRSVRAAAAYILDLNQWGNYSFNLMGGLTHHYVGTFNRVLATGATTGQLADRRQWGNLGNGLRQRYYWGDSRSFRPPTGPLTYIAFDGTTSTVTPTWVTAIADDSTNNVAKNDNDYNYVLGAVNAKYFKGRLILLGALRYDDSKQRVSYLRRYGDFPSNWDGQQLIWRPDAPGDWASLKYTPVGAATESYALTRPRTNNAFGVAEADPRYANVRFADDYNPPPVIGRKWSPSTGAVVHVTRWASLYANYATALSFNTAAAPDVYGRLLPPVEGKGWDAGVRFNLWGDRLNASVSTYRNTEFGNYIDPTSVTNNINTLYQANVYGDTTTGGRNKRNAADINGLVRDTRTRIASGLEFEVVANLTRAWRLTANLGLPKVIERETAPFTRAYVAANGDLFKQVLDDAGGMVNASGQAALKPGITDTGTGGSESTGNEATRAVNAYNTIYSNLANFVVNSRPTTTNPNNANVFTDYTFREGRLRGLSSGVGVNWRGRRVVGYRGGDTIVDPANASRSIDDPTVDGYTPVYAPGQTVWTATLGYKWKIWRHDVALNFRVSNLFNTQAVIWTDTTTTLRPKGGNFTTPARETVLNPYAYQVPRSYSLTARVTF